MLEQLAGRRVDKANAGSNRSASARSLCKWLATTSSLPLGARAAATGSRSTVMREVSLPEARLMTERSLLNRLQT